jgi:hypothetical protein
MSEESTIPRKARDMVADLSSRVDVLEERIMVLEDALRVKHQQKPPKKDTPTPK